MIFFKEVLFYVFNFCLFTGSIALFKHKYIEEEDQKLFYLSIFYKFLATVTLGLLYRYAVEYTSDPETVFTESIKAQQLLIENPKLFTQVFWDDYLSFLPYSMLPRAFFLVKIVCLLNFLTGANYWLDSLWLSLVCLLGVWYLCSTIKKFYPNAFLPSVIAFLYIPTTVFWSSGILKESISFGMLCIMVGLWLHALHKKTFPLLEFLSALLPCYILFKMRFYMLGGFTLVAIPFYLSVKANQQVSSSPRIVTWGSFILSFIFLWTLLNYVCMLYLKGTILEITYYTHNVYNEYELADFVFPNLSISSLSFPPYIPIALWYGLFAPLIWEVKSILFWLDGIINTLTLLMSIYLAIQTMLNKKLLTKWTLLTLMYVLLSAILITISSPNFGSLARYKIAYIPFLHFMFLFYLSEHANAFLDKSVFGRILAYFRS